LKRALFVEELRGETLAAGVEGGLGLRLQRLEPGGREKFPGQRSVNGGKPRGSKDVGGGRVERRGKVLGLLRTSS